MFPVDAHTTASAPSSTALDMATVIPRSLKDPVGFAPSNFSHSSTPSRSESRSARRSGVPPSPSEITGVDGPTGSLSR